MLTRRVCALAAAATATAQHQAHHARLLPALRRYSSRSSSSSRTVHLVLPDKARFTTLTSSRASDAGSKVESASAQYAASAAASIEKAHPLAAKPAGAALNLDDVSDRELLRRLLRRPQRMYLWVGGAVAAGVMLMAFGPELKVGVSKHTADVASKSLQDETLQGHTRELASQIVQTVLNDPNVLDQASQFLQRLVVMESTRAALQELVVYTLNDAETRANVTALASSTVTALLNDPTTRQQVVALVQATVQDPTTVQSVFALVSDLLADDTTRANVTQLLAFTFTQDVVQQTVTDALAQSTHDVLSRIDIQNHAKQFIGTVVKDETVQAQSGDAIWSTMMYAVTPTWLAWIWHHPHKEEEKIEAEEADAVVVEPVKAKEPVAEREEDANDEEEEETDVLLSPRQRRDATRRRLARRRTTKAALDAAFDATLGGRSSSTSVASGEAREEPLHAIGDRVVRVAEKHKDVAIEDSSSSIRRRTTHAPLQTSSPPASSAEAALPLPAQAAEDYDTHSAGSGFL